MSTLLSSTATRGYINQTHGHLYSTLNYLLLQMSHKHSPISNNQAQYLPTIPSVGDSSDRLYLGWGTWCCSVSYILTTVEIKCKGRPIQKWTITLKESLYNKNKKKVAIQELCKWYFSPQLSNTLVNKLFPQRTMQNWGNFNILTAVPNTALIKQP